MYYRFFGLHRAPFSIAPDPRFLYMSERHREALAHLQWGLERDGAFVLLTGEVGTGKTTLSRLLLERIPGDTDIAFVINPRVSATELLATICEELHDPPPPDEHQSLKRLVDRINHHLLGSYAQGRRTVLVIDEAQNLSADLLEQIRLLTNLETSDRKLLQVILLGQPELDAMLRQDRLRQLAQRITARYHLEPLDREELAALVDHRLAVAGALSNPFTERALTALHRQCGGIPRLANVIADRALLGAYATGATRVTPRIVRQAAREVRGEPESSPSRTATLATGLSALLAGIGVVAALWYGALLPSSLTEVTRRRPAPAPVTPPAVGAATNERSAAPAEADGVAEAPSPPAAPVTDADRSDAPAVGNGTAVADPVRAAESVVTAPGADPGDPLRSLWNEAIALNRNAAFEAVLKAWFTPLSLSATDDPCEAVARVGLRCLDYRGGWPALLAMDRPA
ncbi:MAG: AAA family ATPase, partial [Pseudomonadales bacterium]|nr:AAA family ATPase [Pseudomonadales bacterium]